MRSKYFAKRNFLEMSREPLSYIFCLGFPLVMLAIMSVINNSIPEEAHMTLFQIQHIGPGIIIFGFTFVMLFTCLSVATDRSNAFLIRLYASPMKGVNFITGYTLPMGLVCLVQAFITLVACVILGFFMDYQFNIGYLLLDLVFLIPSIVLFVGFGLLFGTLFNEKAAPGLCSIVICLCGMLGGIWMDVEAITGFFNKLCKVLPFYHCVKVSKLVCVGNLSDAMKPFLITLGYAVVVYIVAVFVFRKKMQNDLR